MKPAYDARSGLLRLSVEDLVALGGGEDAAMGGNDFQEAMGRIGPVGSDPASKIAPALQAMRATICTQTVQTLGPDGSRTHWIWLGPDSAAASLQVDGELYDLFSILPAFVPALVARLIHLEPRPQLPEFELDVREGTIPAMHAGDSSRAKVAIDHIIESAPPVWEPWVDELSCRRFRASWVETTWLDRDSQVLGRNVASIDTRLGMVTGSVAPGRADELRATASARHWLSLIQVMSPPEDGGGA